MSGGSLGSLVITMSADIAQMRSDMGKAVQIAENASAEIAKAFGKINLVLAAVFAGKEIIGFIEKSLEAGDQLAKLSQRAGVSVENLGRLKFAAEQSGIGIDDLATGLKKFNIALSGAAAGNPEQSAIFSAMGISLKDANGKLKDTNAILPEVADKFRSYADGQNKAALAAALFGKSGDQWIPLLNQGAAGLKAAGDEAEKLGLVMSTSTAKAAEDLNTKITALTKALTEGLGNRILANVLPSLTSLNTTLQSTSTLLSPLQVYADAVGAGFKIAASGVLILSYGLTVARDQIVTTSRALGDFFHRDFKQAIADFKDGFAQQKVDLGALKTQWSALWDAASQGAAQTIKANDAVGAGVAPNIELARQWAAAIKEATATLGGDSRYLDFIKSLSSTPDELRKNAQAFEALTKANNQFLDSLDQKSRPAIVPFQEQFAKAYAELEEQVNRSKPTLEGIIALETALGERGRVAFLGMKLSAQDTAAGMTTAFENFFSGADKGLRGLAKDILQVFRQQIGKELALDLENTLGIFSRSSAGTGGGFLGALGSFFGALFGSGHAGGGPVSAGMAYPVGEKGPELFVPGTAGNIIPNSTLSSTSSAGVTLVQNFHIDSRSDRAQVVSDIQRIGQQQIGQFAGLLTRYNPGLRM